MTTLAWQDGPGPWILFFPLIWVFAIAMVITVRRRVWRGRGGGPWQMRGGPWQQNNQPAVTAEHSPIAVLGRRFASGEIDEDEYWRRLSVLDEQFGRDLRDGMGGSR